MWADIAIFGGIVGAIVAVVCIFVIYSIKRSINTILDRDLVLFDQNFEIKKKTLDNAFAILDDIAEQGNKVKLSPDFVKKVKTCYNDMLCVMGNVALAEEFLSIASDPDVELNEVKVAEFKLNCRKDIGLSNKGSQVVAKLTAPQVSTMGETETLLRAKSVNNNNKHIETFVTSQPTTQNSRTDEQAQASQPRNNQAPTATTQTSQTQKPVNTQTASEQRSSATQANSATSSPVRPTTSSTVSRTQTTTVRPTSTTRTTTTTTRSTQTGSGENRS